MIRFSHTLFALPFALLAALMALRERAETIDFVNSLFAGARDTPSGPGLPDERAERMINALERQFGITDWSSHPLIPLWTWRELVGILLCMVFARSAAMAFNRLADRKIDALNPRTAMRHLPAGLLSVRGVVLFALVCSALFIASTLLFLPNRLPLYLSVPVLVFLLGYSYSKRFTALAHVWLGAALALAPIAAWIALRGEIAWAPVVLAAAVMLWVAGFDIIYACQDYEFDKQHGLHSVPARLGIAGALRLAAALHVAMIVALLVLPTVYPLFGTLYYVGIAAIAALLFYEHRLVRPDDLSRVNLAFFNVNIVVSMGLLALGAIDLLT